MRAFRARILFPPAICSNCCSAALIVCEALSICRMRSIARREISPASSVTFSILTSVSLQFSIRPSKDGVSELPWPSRPRKPEVRATVCFARSAIPWKLQQTSTTELSICAEVCFNCSRMRLKCGKYRASSASTSEFCSAVSPATPGGELDEALLALLCRALEHFHR